MLYLSCEKYEKKQKEPEFGPILSFRFRQIERTMQICKEKLTSTEEDVNAILKELDD